MAAEPPPSVVWIRTAALFLRERHQPVLLGAALGLTVLWLLTGVHAVGHRETAAVQRFGRVVADAVEPGLHLALPRGIDKVVKVQTGEVHRLQVGGDLGSTFSLITADENLIELSLTVQYRITRLRDHLFGVADPDEVVRQAVRTALTETVAGLTVEEVLTVGKAAVQTRVRGLAQEQLDRCGAGVALVAVNLQTVAPPAEAADAFRRVVDARAQAAEAVNQAEGERESQLRRAHGEASQQVSEAEGRAAVRTAGARGAAERFRQLAAAARETPALTRQDLHLEMLRKVLPRLRVVVLAPGEAPRLEVNLDARGAPKPAPPTPGQERRPPP